MNPFIKNNNFGFPLSIYNRPTLSFFLSQIEEVGRCKTFHQCEPFRDYNYNNKRLASWTYNSSQQNVLSPSIYFLLAERSILPACSTLIFSSLVSGLSIFIFSRWENLTWPGEGLIKYKK